MVLRNPPSALSFILPLGLFSYRVAFAIWLVFSVFVLTGCARVSSSLSGMKDLIHSCPRLFMPILFGPTVVLLSVGQIAVLVLLGITTCS